MTTVTAERSVDLTDRIGVNAHLNWEGAAAFQYVDPVKVETALDYLGIDLVRAGTPDPVRAEVLSRYDYLVKSGIEFNLGTHPNNSPTTQVSYFRNFVSKYPGSVVSFELPNEIDLWPVTYNGMTGHEGARAYSNEIVRQVYADPLLQNIPVLNYTVGKEQPTNYSDADYGNLHHY